MFVYIHLVENWVSEEGTAVVFRLPSENQQQSSFCISLNNKNAESLAISEKICLLLSPFYHLKTSKRTVQTIGSHPGLTGSLKHRSQGQIQLVAEGCLTNTVIHILRHSVLMTSTMNSILPLYNIIKTDYTMTPHRITSGILSSPVIIRSIYLILLS